LSIDYTNCGSEAKAGGTDSDFSDIPDDKYTSLFKDSSTTTKPQWRRNETTKAPPYGVEQETNVCSLRFNIPNDIGPPVLLYYRLTNFYQNHRRYVKSLDSDQLLGNALGYSTIQGSACDPLTVNNDTQKAYYPCGLIANSLFNDTINSPVAITSPGVVGGKQTYQMTNKGIAWNSDTELYKKTEYTRDQVEPPPNWRKRYPDGYTEENDIPDISKYEELHVWMRTAGLPTFSKLALRNDDRTMKAGVYQLDIDDCGLPFFFFDSNSNEMQISLLMLMVELNPSCSPLVPSWVVEIHFLGSHMLLLVAYVCSWGLCSLLPIWSNRGM
jgi:LEM3 (ligand-effect modulator 3) family / CDC50 family